LLSAPGCRLNCRRFAQFDVLNAAAVAIEAAILAQSHAFFLLSSTAASHRRQVQGKTSASLFLSHA
jgi:hypothetical protein